MIEKVIFAIGGAAVGAVVSWYLTKRHYLKEIDILCEDCTRDVNAAKAEVENVKLHYGQELSDIYEKISANKWDEISEDIKKQLSELEEEGPKEATSHKPTADGPNGDITRKRNVEKDVPYHTFYKPATADIPVNKDNISTEAIVKNEWNTVKFITEDEYDDNEWGYEKEYLDFYQDSEMIFRDLTDEMLDEDEVVTYTGVDIDTIRQRFHKEFDAGNDTPEFFIVNEPQAVLYCLSLCAGEAPRP